MGQPSVKDLLFTLLEIHDTIQSLESVPGAVNSTHTGDSVPLGIFCVHLADRIKGRPTGTDLINKS